MSTISTRMIEAAKEACITHEKRMMLGEGGLYRPSDRTLHYLDIEREPVTALYIAQLNALGEVQGEPRMVEIQGSRHVTAIAFRKHAPGYIATTHSGLAYLSEDTGKVEHLPGGLGEILSQEEQSYMRFNDGYCDSKGHFYFHAMSRDGSKKHGRLFMYEPSMKSKADLKELAEDFQIGNGPVIDEERKKCYFNVTSECLCYVYDWDSETGLLSNKQTFFDNSKRRPMSLTDPLTMMLGSGGPDGHTLDSKGRLYQTVFGRGLIERFTPDGQCDLQIEVGARCPTSAVFGGDGLRSLYVTSASMELLPGEIAVKGDLGGNILKVDLDDILEEGVVGLVKPDFDG